MAMAGKRINNRRGQAQQAREPVTFDVASPIRRAHLEDFVGCLSILWSRNTPDDGFEYRANAGWPLESSSQCKDLAFRAERERTKLEVETGVA